MTVEVETYYNPKQWGSHESYNRIKDAVHICATKNMAEGIKTRYQCKQSDEFSHIFTIHQVMSGFFQKWHQPENIMEQYLILCRLITETPGDVNIKSSFRNNAQEVLDTIRFLVFSGVEPSSLKGVEKSKNHNLENKEKFFVNLWGEMEKETPIYCKMRESLTKKYRTEKINEILNKINDKEIPLVNKSQKTIVLHGFYFITPEQQRFLKLLERAGYELIFFQFYDDRFPNTFDFSKSFISRRFGWTDHWNIQKRPDNPNTVGANFLQSFEEGKHLERSETKKVVAYDSFFDFLHSVIMSHYPIGQEASDTKEDVQLVATNADILNELLIQYYPERFADKRNFLSYPVGQFILKIHEMRKGDKLILNKEILMACFTSGWLSDKEKGLNAQQFTYELNQLLPFFARCHEIDEWLECIDNLEQQYNSILPLFHNEGDNRVHGSTIDPFSKIGYLSLNIDDVKQLHIFILLLKEMAENLFDMSQDGSYINEHFKRLSNLMHEYNPAKNKVQLQRTEKELVEKINHKLSIIDDSQRFLYEDIGEAIRFYLSGKLSDDEETFIKPFIEVDGEAFKDSDRSFYLTGLDEQGLPLGKFATPWPLQEITYSNLSEWHRELEMNELRNKSVKDISRYLMFISLEFTFNEKSELSWMRNFLDRENLQPTVYVQYLNMDIHENSSTLEEREEGPYNIYDFQTYKLEDDNFHEAMEGLKYEDILAEYQLCPRRFYYGYVLDKYPTFSDEFIHRFLFSEIINTVKQCTKKNKEEVITYVEGLFPQWTRFQIESMAQRSIRYTPSKKNYQFPGLKKKKKEDIYRSVKVNKKKIIGEIERPEEEMAIMMEAKPGFECRFCPFLDLCPDGTYAVD
ncbi:hypothetical protein [Salimicrobium album]|uniref:PD-(D/E)XK nuclease superfamily protein n=1 Tax=Salimicrobium album TaxID=50717 RepID=A0A1H3E3E2_9BACI|nr:hypothetical protein [Salimicrobium album]SDX73252.1 hypothetical protein SAMN04488081_1232 [Salimicrobium album]